MKFEHVDAMLDGNDQESERINKLIEDEEKKLLLYFEPANTDTKNVDSLDNKILVNFQNLSNVVEEHVARDIQRIPAFEFFSKVRMLEDRSKAIQKQMRKSK